MIEFDAPTLGMVGIPSVISMPGQNTRKFGSRERQTERRFMRMLFGGFHRCTNVSSNTIRFQL